MLFGNRLILIFCTLCYYSIFNIQYSILQASPVFLKIGSYSFDVDDFEYVYHKNRMAGKQTPDECLALYIPYKLKIAAAKDAGLDALPEIIDEWTRFRNQLTTKQIADEFLDGLLLYAMTNSMVWSKAARDSAGLKTFYKKNARNFRWVKRMKATVYYCSDAKVAERLRSAVKNKNEGEGRLPNGLFTFFCDPTGVSPCVDTVFHTFQKGANTVADHVHWKKGCSKILEWNRKFVFLDVHSILRPARKTFDEARGQVIAGYQDELERKWVEQLKRQYPVTVDEKVWADIKKKYAE